MMKLFTFFFAVLGLDRAARRPRPVDADDGPRNADLVGIIRVLLDKQPDADLLALRESAQTFITEVEMELGRRDVRGWGN